MGVIDRSAEFREILGELVAKGGGELAGRNAAATAPPQAPSGLNVWSAEIATGIHQVGQKVEELGKMARQKGIFTDKSSEVQDLTYDVKKELDLLQKKIEVLDNKAKVASNNKIQQAHATSMVESLKARHMEVTKDLTRALESRTKALEQQHHRRHLYSAGCSAFNNPFTERQQRPSGNVGDLEGGSGATHGGQQSQLYHNSRAEAVQSLQRTIGELVTMFQKMGAMVAKQAEDVQRIDEDLIDTIDNVKEGEGQLLQYFHHISSNRALIMKVFLILIFFVAFFIIFLA